MKKLILSALVLFSAQAFATVKCYKVVNPKSIVVVARSEDGDALKNKIEFATDVKIREDFDDQSSRTSEFSIAVSTANMRFVHEQFDTGYKTSQMSASINGAEPRLYVMESGLSFRRSTLMADGMIQGWVGSQETESDMPNAILSLVTAPLLDEVACAKK